MIHRRNRWLVFFMGLGLQLTPQARAETKPSPVQEIRFEQNLGALLPRETHLIDEQGESHPLSFYMGRTPLVLVFSYFRCPNLCTLVLNGLVQVLRKIPDQPGKDFQILTVSIDPSDHSTRALTKKRAYVASYLATDVSKPSDSGRSTNASLGWHFLTAAPDQENELRKLANSVGFHYSRDPVSGEYSHPSGFIVVSPSGRISQYFFGIQFDPQKLHGAIVQAQSEKEGSWVEEILLYCFHYDPKLARNGPLIMKSIRFTGVIAVLCMGFFFFYLNKGGHKEP